MKNLKFAQHLFWWSSQNVNWKLDCQREGAVWNLCFDEDINTCADLFGSNYNQWALLTLHFDWVLQHVEANRETMEQNVKSD